MEKITVFERVLGCCCGIFAGDAAGLPYEGMARPDAERLDWLCIISETAAFWSDDTSMNLALCDCLTQGYSFERAAEDFIKWFYRGKYTPSGAAVGWGRTTAEAMGRLGIGCPPEESGAPGYLSNGNGALMRVLPAGIYFDVRGAEGLREVVRLSEMTHAHPLSTGCCIAAAAAARDILFGAEVVVSLRRCLEFAEEKGYCFPEYSAVREALREGITPRTPSDGFAPSTLAAVAAAMGAGADFSGALTAALRLGGDTDTVGALAGGFAGLYYGYSPIPAGLRSLFESCTETYGIFSAFARMIDIKKKGR